jgi:acyl CoA:acetate/3-ketoacid CoA transferase alpha subunit/acyl CoA:acetate/3-ketoacid CoA transferase beta subunit
MAVVREILRQKINNLKVISIVGGIEMEWLLAGKAIGHLVFSFLSMEAFGLASNFRRVIERKEIDSTEIEGLSIIKGLEAAASGMTFFPFPGPFGADIVKESPEYYRVIECPFTGKEHIAVQAIFPDVAVIHAQRADERGNVQMIGTSASDLDMAKAAKKTIVTVEEIVSPEEICRTKAQTKLSRLDVDMVIEQPFGATPTSCVPYYSVYQLQLMRDVGGLRDPDKAAEYISQLIGKTEEDFQENIGGEAARKKLMALAKKTDRIEMPAELDETPAEEYDTSHEMVASIARLIDDGDLCILGSFTPLAYCAYILAKLTNAPNSIVVGYSGVDAQPFQLSFHSSEAACIENAMQLWSMTECINSNHLASKADVEAVSSAEFDKEGSINLSWLKIVDKKGNVNPRGLRLPGGAGAPCAIKMHRKEVAYFARHSKRVFVDKVNYVTGSRLYISDEEREKAGVRPGPVLVVTNLCVMEMRQRGKWKVLSLHKGVKAKDVIENTGFPVEIPKDCPVTEPPTRQVVELLNNHIDPNGTRYLDFISAKEAAKELPAKLQREWDEA